MEESVCQRSNWALGRWGVDVARQTRRSGDMAHHNLKAKDLLQEVRNS